MKRIEMSKCVRVCAELFVLFSFFLFFVFCCYLFLSFTNDDGHSHYNNFQLKGKCQYSPTKSIFSSRMRVWEESLAWKKDWAKSIEGKNYTQWKKIKGKRIRIQLKRNRNENKSKEIFEYREKTTVVASS